jgi:ribonuclease P/MRP protein subunit RPP20
MKEKRTRRKVLKPPTVETDIYVSKKTIIPAQLERITQLFENGNAVVSVHGLGVAIITAIQVALRYRQQYPLVQWNIETNTVQLVDDVEGADMDQDAYVSTRSNSAIHIHLRKPINI